MRLQPYYCKIHSPPAIGCKLAKSQKPFLIPLLKDITEFQSVNFILKARKSPSRFGSSCYLLQERHFAMEW